MANNVDIRLFIQFIQPLGYGVLSFESNTRNLSDIVTIRRIHHENGHISTVMMISFTVIIQDISVLQHH